MQVKILLFVLIIALFFSCTPREDSLTKLVAAMSGSFSSQQQAKSDTAYHDVRLHMIPIWMDRTDGRWLYVEQAAAENMDKPYRQRIYNLTQISDSTFRSMVFALPDPLQYAGAWEMPDLLNGLEPGSLKEREGCDVILKQQGEEIYVGSTESLRCGSSLRGAAYATSIVLIMKNQIYSWDRGFDIEGKQVWGATEGGYIFKRIQSQ